MLSSDGLELAAVLNVAAFSLANQYSLDQEQEREMEIIRQQVEGDAYIDELRREAGQDATRFTDTVLSKETQGELNDLIKAQRRTRIRPSARR